MRAAAAEAGALGGCWEGRPMTIKPQPRAIAGVAVGRNVWFGVLLLTVVIAVGGLVYGQALAPLPAASSSTAFVVESYYRVRWGSEEEFMTLFRKNHVPFLRRQIEKGILLDVRLDAPREHQPEESRWDLRMTLVYRDAATAYRADNITEADYNAIIRDDQAEEAFNREERRRFELLLAHWDVNVKRLDLVSAK